MSGFERSRERILLRDDDASVTAHLAEVLSIPYALARVLSIRKLSSFDECKTFFRPDLTQFHDPFLFNDMERAVERIARAIAGNERIAIYGDYDVDGITATALLMRVLHILGAECTYHLPNRLIDGYGLSESGIQGIAEKGVTLMITVDCGISALQEITAAQRRGIDCIITDHHEVPGELPPALAVIDPKNPVCRYPFRHLAGVGVALKLCQALAVYFGKGSELWEPYLDIVALGTAADIVPLTDENRVIASIGFQHMTHTVHKGLQALINQQGLTGKVLSTSQVVFQLAPCINAAGRLGDPAIGVELLLTDDDDSARHYAAQLRNANVERRELDSMVADDVGRWVAQNTDAANQSVIVAGCESWHVGVIGIVASKMVERFNRPTILFSIGPDGYARGSGRSIPALNLLDALDGCADLLETYGGHSAAAGMNIKTDAIDIFRKRFDTIVREMVPPAAFTPVVAADAEVDIPSLTPKFFRIIQQMEPFGPGNMRPVFLSRDVQHRFAPRIVGNTHVKMSLVKEGAAMDAIAFNCGDRFREIKAAPSLTVVYTLDQNEWDGKVSLQMKVKGFAL